MSRTRSRRRFLGRHDISGGDRTFSALRMALPLLIRNGENCEEIFMTALKQIRWTAIAMLITGLAMAFSAGLIESEALAAQEGQFAHTASAMAGKMFTVASILILIWATEWQRAKTSARLQKLEEELSLLKRRTAAVA